MPVQMCLDKIVNDAVSERAIIDHLPPAVAFEKNSPRQSYSSLRHLRSVEQKMLSKFQIKNPMATHPTPETTMTHNGSKNGLVSGIDPFLLQPIAKLRPHHSPILGAEMGEEPFP